MSQCLIKQIDKTALIEFGKTHNYPIASTEGSVWFAAYVGGMLCGYGSITEGGRRDYSLYNGFVIPEYRGNGIQVELIKARVHYAIEKGCRTVICEVYDGNIPSIKSLERAGLEYFGNRNTSQFWGKHVA